MSHDDPKAPMPSPVTASPVTASPDAIAAALHLLAQQPDVRVLRAVERPLAAADLADPAQCAGVFVDVQTTGTDEQARILEIGALPFRFVASTGEIVGVGAPVGGYNDPRVEIPEAVVQRTGITNAMVAGKHLPVDQLARLFEHADLVVAHYARFDRPMVERVVDAASDRPWSCSVSEVPWHQAGHLSTALDALLMTHARRFLVDRCAVDHCYGMLALMTTPFPADTPAVGGTTPFQQLLGSARQKTGFLWAPYTPFETRELFRDRGWHYDPGREGHRPRAWFARVPAAHLPYERTWVTTQVYHGNPPATFRAELVGPRRRYSELTAIHA